MRKKKEEGSAGEKWACLYVRGAGHLSEGSSACEMEILCVQGGAGSSGQEVVARGFGLSPSLVVDVTRET